jgi:DNA-directed RNA polymerase specialized sigma subunit
MADMTPDTATLVCDMAGIKGQSRSAMLLVYADGLTGYAAAQQLGITQSTVSRARERFIAAVELHNRLPWPIEIA